MDEHFYKRILESICEGIYYIDNKRIIKFWNKGAEKITGFTYDEVINKHCHINILKHIDDKGNELCFGGCPLCNTIEDGQRRKMQIYLQHKNGHRVPVEIYTIPIYDKGKIVGGVEMFTDITEKKQVFTRIKELEELEKLTMKDYLTNLPNRRYLERYLESKLSEYKNMGIEFGIAFIDVDNFKKVNDTYGHDMGDKVLKMLSCTYTNSLRKSDIVGRWGGEEFIVIFVGIDEKRLPIITEKIRMLAEKSSIRMDNDLKVTISIGATMIKKDDTIGTLIKRADELMYHSKKKGKNRVTIG